MSKADKESHKKIFLTLLGILLGLLAKWAFDVFRANNCWISTCSLPSLGFGGFFSILIYSLIKWRFG
jgi:hypothetical protein